MRVDKSVHEIVISPNNIHSSQNSLDDDDDNAKFYDAAQDEHDAAVVHLHLYHELLNSEDHVDIFLNHLDTDHLFGLQYRLSPVEYAIHCIKERCEDPDGQSAATQVTDNTSSKTTKPASNANDRPHEIEPLEDQFDETGEQMAPNIIVEIKYTLRMLGVPINGPALLLGENNSVVLNTTFPSSQLKKKHNAICYHRVRKACAAGILRFSHISSEENIADILTKSWKEGFLLLDKESPLPCS